MDKGKKLFEMMEKVNPDFKPTLNEDSCWKGYKQYGMKEKDGKEVPNCVPIDEQPVPVGQQVQNQSVGAKQPTQPTAQPTQPSDVKALSRASQSAATVKSASSRINTATEFPEAFRVWFSGLGYSPDNPAVSIMKVKTEIEKVMKNMGYK